MFMVSRLIGIFLNIRFTCRALIYILKMIYLKIHMLINSHSFITFLLSLRLSSIFASCSSSSFFSVY